MRGIKGCLIVVVVMNIALALYFNYEMNSPAEQADVENASLAEQAASPGGTSERVTPDSIPAEPETPPPTDLRIIPPVKKGTMAAMWSGFLETDEILIPTFGLENLSERLKENPNLNAADMPAKYLYVGQDVQGKMLKFFAVYTDHRLVRQDQMFLTTTPRAALEMALYDPNADGGIYFNPKSRICDTAEYACGTNRFGIAEIIGFLDAPRPVPADKPYHQLANEALAVRKWYLVQYYWGMSRREGRAGDDWTQAELAKLHSWHELDFPGARERAKGELDWFIGKYGSSPGAEALKKRFAETP